MSGVSKDSRDALEMDEEMGQLRVRGGTSFAISSAVREGVELKMLSDQHHEIVLVEPEARDNLLCIISRLVAAVAKTRPFIINSTLHFLSCSFPYHSSINGTH